MVTRRETTTRPNQVKGNYEFWNLSRQPRISTHSAKICFDCGWRISTSDSSYDSTSGTCCVGNKDAGHHFFSRSGPDRVWKNSKDVKWILISNDCWSRHRVVVTVLKSQCSQQSNEIGKFIFKNYSCRFLEKTIGKRKKKRYPKTLMNNDSSRQTGKRHVLWILWGD